MHRITISVVNLFFPIENRRTPEKGRRFLFTNLEIDYISDLSTNYCLGSGRDRFFGREDAPEPDEPDEHRNDSNKADGTGKTCTAEEAGKAAEQEESPGNQGGNGQAARHLGTAPGEVTKDQ